MMFEERVGIANTIATLLREQDYSAKAWTGGDHVRVYVARELSRGQQGMGFIAVRENGDRSYAALSRQKAGIRDLVEAALKAQSRTTYVVDLDTLSTAFVVETELPTMSDKRRAVDEIAKRVEMELAARGVNAIVKRCYDTTGARRDSNDADPTVWATVLIERADDLRAIVLGASS